MPRERDRDPDENARPAPRPATRRRLLVALVILPALLAASACAGSRSDAEMEPAEHEVSFAAGDHTVPGTLLLPRRRADQKVPAALIIGGSGPTDRNGNSRLLPGEVNTNRNFAAALAEQGVASLRYDKLGSGAAGVPERVDRADVGFELFVDEAAAAHAYLKARPEVDAGRVLLLGHSEGALIALVLADRWKTADQPRALILAAPPGMRYLDLLSLQFGEQYARAREMRQVTAEQADAALAEVERVVASLRSTGTLPERIWPPTVAQVFRPDTARFLAQADAYDPRALASGLPAELPVLVLRGAKDQQVSAADAQAILDGLRAAGNTRSLGHELTDVNHVFKEVAGPPDPAADYTNPALPFSREATARLADFLRGVL
jgi:fermentation-respiration switch protein FrsA (DUF1100 family)